MRIMPWSEEGDGEEEGFLEAHHEECGLSSGMSPAAAARGTSAGKTAMAMETPKMPTREKVDALRHRRRVWRLPCPSPIATGEDVAEECEKAIVVVAVGGEPIGDLGVHGGVDLHGGVTQDDGEEGFEDLSHAGITGTGGEGRRWTPLFHNVGNIYARPGRMPAITTLAATQ